jgi:hypothetical protein
MEDGSSLYQEKYIKIILADRAIWTPLPDWYRWLSPNTSPAQTSNPFIVRYITTINTD